MTLKLQVDPNAPSGYSLVHEGAPARVPNDPRIALARRRPRSVGAEPRADEVDPAPELPPLPGQADPPWIEVGTVRGEITGDGRANVYTWSGVSWELVASNEIASAQLEHVVIWAEDHNYAPDQITLYKDPDTASYTMWIATERVFESTGPPADPEWLQINTEGGGSGGTDEVWIGTDDPILTNPTIELWYDSDAPSPSSAVPVGGTTGQVLAKTAAGNYATGWVNPANCVFTDLAALKLWTPPDGATAVTTDKGRMWLRIGGVWRCVGGSVPQFLLQRSAAYQVASGAVVGIPWDQEVIDTDAMHAPNANTVVIPADYPGRWRFEMTIAVSTNASGGTWASWYQPSNSGLRWGWVETGRAAGGGIVLSSITEYRAIAGETINAYCFFNAGAMDIAGSNTRFLGQYMGPA